MHDDMVERVAKVLALWNTPNFGLDERSATERATFRAKARAAIEAVREPTEAMLDAVETYTGSTPDTLVTSWHKKRIWQGMIDAALVGK